MNKFQRIFLIIFHFCLGTTCYAQMKNDAPLSKDAPHDKLFDVQKNQLKQFDSLIAPYVAQAKASLSKAKARFLKGLNTGEAFFVTTRIFDKDNKFEQVFIRVKVYDGDTIKGTIANELNIVKEFKFNQLISFKEEHIIDWLITKPDGSEEGNFVGKFLDTRQ